MSSSCQINHGSPRQNLAGDRLFSALFVGSDTNVSLLLIGILLHRKQSPNSFKQKATATRSRSLSIARWSLPSPPRHFSVLSIRSLLRSRVTHETQNPGFFVFLSPSTVNVATCFFCCPPPPTLIRVLVFNAIIVGIAIATGLRLVGSLCAL